MQKKSKILIVSNNMLTQYMFLRLFKIFNYESLFVEEVRNIVKFAFEFKVDLVIIDAQGIDSTLKYVFEHVKSQINIPIIIYSKTKNINQLVAALDAGAAEYITKPADLEEIVARVRKVLRENGKHEMGKEISCRDMVLYPYLHEVKVKGEQVILSELEYSLLLYLVLNANRVVSREEILTQAWRDKSKGSSSAVNVYISYLRRKIDKRFNEIYIETAVDGYVLRTIRTKKVKE